MRPLMLDFKPVRRVGPLSWSLLVAGVVLAAGVFFLQQQQDAQLAEQQQRLQAIETHLNGNTAKRTLSAAQTREQTEHLEQMHEVSKQLRRPWERLFAMLEALPRENVALLSLTPDARKGQVRISAEARDLEAMLAFHKLLEASDELHDVSLLSHEIVAQVPEQPVQFNLSASWEISDANP
ncbi:PilN domain-containing protein [Pseudomonas sp. R5(2019)]|uniref:PilN domain-containing protein n=1 Tax=Pseudomonas sp. R5(2019) TaxID=2697566 RepID=UPI001411B871|nr:PilN domain-containing protein [Pseudomonas sp. R5(2019)]NBA96734.1 pilus assembly protein [Pseudomonas sp. R5(2019)]